MQLTIFSGMLSELQNWIMKELVFFYGSQWSLLDLLFHGGKCFEGILGI